MTLVAIVTNAHYKDISAIATSAVVPSAHSLMGEYIVMALHKIKYVTMSNSSSMS